MEQPAVAHVLRKLDPLEWGGTETHVFELAARQAQRGWRTEVHAPLGPSDPAQAATVPVVRYRAFCPFLGPAERRRELFRSSGNIVSLNGAWRLATDRRIALAHVHTLKRIGGGVRTAMRLTGRPYVVSVHGPLLAEAAMVADDTRRRLEGLIDLGQPLGALLGARRVIDDAARVICFNDDEHAALRARIGARAVRMDQGVDAARLGAGSVRSGQSRWPQLACSALVVVVGRLSRQKNQLLALQAFARGAPPNAHLAFAGAATDPGYEQTLREQARALGVEARVHLLGNVPAAALPDLLAMAELVLMPSQHEAFGLVLLEAWAAGRAVLFSALSGLRDLGTRLGEPRCALAEADVGTWAAALTRALGEPGWRREVGERGRALVQRSYDWNAMTDLQLQLYREVLAEHRARRAA